MEESWGAKRGFSMLFVSLDIVQHLGREIPFLKLVWLSLSRGLLTFFAFTEFRPLLHLIRLADDP